jgi:riboflavin biosynthesis pyrimidine reductase
MKPYVICHMVTSIDGKILGGRWGKIPGPKGSADLFETTAASFGIGAWIVGTTTMKEFSGRPQKLPRAPKDFSRADFIAKPNAKRLAIGADVKGVLRFQENEVEGDHTVVVTTERVPDAYLLHLQNAGVSYLICGKREIDLPLALSKLARAFKLRKLMAQGGGKFNGSMLAAGLIDEISHITVPVADGGTGVSSFFDIPGDPPRKSAASLRLTSHRMLPGGITWNRYRVTARHTQ